MAALPSALQTAVASPTTSATTGASIATTLVPSPGARFRCRVWAWGLAAASNMAAGSVLADVRADPAGLLAYLGVSNVGNRTDHMQFPGGVACSESAAVIVVHNASAPSLSLRVWVAYTIEAVT